MSELRAATQAAHLTLGQLIKPAELRRVLSVGR
jgi:hypothetical protein